MRVIPDVPAITKRFDYLVPDDVGDQVRVGTMVRIELHGRRVGGWVEAVDPPLDVDVALKPLAKVSGIGPDGGILDLSTWAAWRWAGRPAALLRAASPPRMVRSLPAAPRRPAVGATGDAAAVAAVAGGVRVLRLPPTTSQLPVLLEAARLGDALIVVPSVHTAHRVAGALRRAGVPVSLVPDQWAGAAVGGVVVGARAAAWAPVRDLAAAVVLDEHDEVHQSERTPTWHARDVVVERARRSGVPCALVSATPSLEALALGPLVVLDEEVERDGWATVEVLDRRVDDQPGLFSSELVEHLRSAERSVCVLNRIGRAQLLACGACDELVRCDRCDASVTQPEAGLLRCRRCAAERPAVCARCGAVKLKNLRAGVSRVREELEALLRRPVVEVTGATAGEVLAEAGCYVGTEAVLHQVRRADVVAFLELDQELLAPRYRAAEQALGLLGRAARLVGARTGGGRVVVQTRLPDHEVVRAAALGQPWLVADAEATRRAELGWPPAVAMAVVSGEAAEPFVEKLRGVLGIELLGPKDSRWLVRAADHQVLCDALAAVERPPGRLRVEVDPLRI